MVLISREGGLDLWGRQERENFRPSFRQVDCVTIVTYAEERSTDSDGVGRMEFPSHDGIMLLLQHGMGFQDVQVGYLTLSRHLTH